MRLITRSLGAIALFCLTGCAGAPAANPASTNAVSGPIVPNPEPLHHPPATNPSIKRDLDNLEKSVKSLRDSLAPDSHEDKR